ncbi:hypothetical protein [uncultured Cohaesibacter sp.]|uniref:hypothetical protein n=1 Tax=uncultured Cohaesibacter sp. TaxID=1002546 RepID=UPI0029C92259|nr:hypothetical protein [uncultured Cohaesibacter sp.]
MRSLSMMLALMICLSGCASTGSRLDISGNGSASSAVTDWDDWPVPTLKTYDAQFVDGLIDELQATSPDSRLRVCVADLMTLRQQICAINDSQASCQLMRQEK